jgi:mono/diheme cytochrome c family protein
MMLQAKGKLAIGGAVVLLAIGVLWLTGTLRSQSEAPGTFPSIGETVPQEYAVGASLFNAHCARCHGLSAVGTDQGPSFLSMIYAPNHHSDMSFHLAVQQGVRAHHWRVGNMPSVPEVTPDDVTQIIAYVRWLQEQVGVR